MIEITLKELVGPPSWVRFALWDESPPPLLYHWSRACASAIRRGTVVEPHKFRDKYQTILLAHIKIVEGYLSLFYQIDSDDLGCGSFGPSEYESASQFPERLARIREALQTHYNSLFPRLGTIDDLEQIVLETASPSNANLKEIGATHSPPQSWYDESADLLTPMK